MKSRGGPEEMAVFSPGAAMLGHPLLGAHPLVREPVLTRSGEELALLAETWELSRLAWDEATLELIVAREVLARLRLPDMEHPLQIPEEAVAVRRLLSLLDSPSLRFLLAMPSGVQEGFSIEAHTAAVLHRFALQRPYLRLERLSAEGLASAAWLDSFFTVLLATHDLGKGLAVFLGSKEKQHQYTEPLLSGVMGALGFPENDVRLAAGLMGNDVLGSLIKGEIGHAEAVARIRRGASQSSLDECDFYLLLRAYFICDASAYPYLHHEVFGGSPLTEELRFAREPGRSAMMALDACFGK